MHEIYVKCNFYCDKYMELSILLLGGRFRIDLFKSNPRRNTKKQNFLIIKLMLFPSKSFHILSCVSTRSLPAVLAGGVHHGVELLVVDLPVPVQVRLVDHALHQRTRVR